MTLWNLQVGADTDVGRHRQRNEDSFCVLLAGEDLPSDVPAVVAVADGMGGHEAGDVASAFVIDAIRAAFAPDGELRRLESDLAPQLAAMLRRANVDLHAAAVEQGAARGMGSTITLGVVRGQELVVAHVGDSRLYRFRAGQIEQITEDHSWTAEQRRRGLISEEEEAHHPRRNLLTDCIGVDREITVFTTSLSLRDGDRFLICSDGLFGPVSDDEIATILMTSDPEAAASLLVERANDAGGPDNITAVVLDVASAERASESLSESGHVERSGERDGESASLARAAPQDDSIRAEAAPGRSVRFVPRWTLASAAIVLVLGLIWGWNRSSTDSEREGRDADPADSRSLEPGSSNGVIGDAGSRSEPGSSSAPHTSSLRDAQNSEDPMDGAGGIAAIDSADTTQEAIQESREDH